LEHIGFRRKREASPIVSEHAQVSGVENVFGRYRLVQRLNEIGVGEAHVAKLVGMNGFEKRVVIWRVDATRTEDAALCEAVMCEARQAASLSHANVAQVLDLGIVDGTCFVATEHVSGQTLEKVLEVRQGLPWPVAAHIAQEIAAALSYAHSRRTPNGELLRLVHRRLAPSRIVLSSAGDVKLTGFGTSWAWPPQDEYRSPEEARGEPVDGRADVVALGVVLRRCLPQAGVPSALQDVIEGALHPYPEHRPTAAELRQDLIQILHAADGPVTPREVAELAVVAAPRRRTAAEGYF
jgi:serine/threonine-protein kinase